MQDKEYTSEMRKRYLKGETSRPSTRDPKEMKGGDHADEDSDIRARRLAEFKLLPKTNKYDFMDPQKSAERAAESTERMRAMKRELDRVIRESRER